ncbi:MAG: Crp/Fnr family transcriptional regulator [Rhodoferax sp.]|nr:Crp/Fnr family transcriptional regulator [Rhodoferax sp.]
MPPETAPAHGYVFKQLKRLGLSDTLVLQTSPLIKVQAYDLGKRLWTKGEDITHWMFIIQGLVSASVSTGNSDATPISIYGKGAWFGEQSIINRKASFADYVCLTPTEVLTLPATQFDQLFAVEPNFARFVAKLMAWRVQKTSETLSLMKMGNPCMRVTMGLAQFAEALAYRSDRPPTIGVGDGIEIPIPQNTLAALCGVSRTLFSEYVQQLASHGWLALSYGKLEILSISTWHAFARSQREHGANHLNANMDDLLLRFDQLARL